MSNRIEAKEGTKQAIAAASVCSERDHEEAVEGILSAILETHPTNRQRYVKALHAALAKYGACAGDERDSASRQWAAESATYKETHFPYI